MKHRLTKQLKREIKLLKKENSQLRKDASVNSCPMCAHVREAMKQGIFVKDEPDVYEKLGFKKTY